MKNLIQVCLFALAVILLLGIVCINTWLAFFSDREYTGAMAAMSTFWFAAGFTLLSASMKEWK